MAESDLIPPKPVPRSSPESLPYWQAAAAHRLEVPRCNVCGAHWFPPSRSCPHCQSADMAFARVSGNGRVFSFVIYDRVYHPAFAGDVPYVVALVELDEGPRLITNIVGIAPEDVRCELRVEVEFRPAGDGLAIPCFKPADG